MSVYYNRLAGLSVERLAALSDGIFAVAMTLLVLDLRLPGKEAAHSEQDLWRMLCAIGPQLLAYLMSFLTLGIFWNGQQVQLNLFDRGDQRLTWIHLAFLFAVTLMPFSTRLLAEFIALRTALVWYWLNVLLLGLVLLGSWRYASRAGLLRQDLPAGTSQAVVRRIAIAQALYALGAALCLFDNYASIGFIMLVQLNYAIAPKLGKLWRI